jgi:hypothetical protein
MIRPHGYPYIASIGWLRLGAAWAADTLVNSCPSESALTPVGRMKMMRARLAAVRQFAIRPSLVRFYEALDNGQKVRFAGMR